MRKRVYRNEWKYLISYPEARLLMDRLKPFMHLDAHASDGGYLIRSLYFDDWKNTAYEEKIMGTMNRVKWRIRIYDYSDKTINLERKKKSGSYIYKESARITREDFERILDNDFSFLLDKDENLCREFYFECMSKVMRPKVIVDYERVPYVLDEGTVRITFDSDVRAAYGSFDIFEPTLPAMYVLEPEKLVLEVKYTEFLPDIIRQLLPLRGQEFTALSKYTTCYEKVHHLTDITSGVSKSILRGRIRDEH